MKTQLLRAIDKWFGILLCYVLTMVERMRSLFRSTSDEGPPRSILFISVVELGALSVAYSAVSLARTKFPGARIYILTTELGEELCDTMGFLENEKIIVSSVDRPLPFLSDSLRSVFRMRRHGIDAAVCIEPYLRYSAIMCYLSGARMRSGFHRFSEEGNYLGDLFTHRLIYNPHIHVGHSYMSLVEALSEKASIAEPLVKRKISGTRIERFVAPRDEDVELRVRAELQELLPSMGSKRIVLLNPNGKDDRDLPLRRWPDESYIELALRILSTFDVVIGLTGIHSEWEHNEKIKARLSPGLVLNLAGRFTMTQLIHLYHLSVLLVTNDSGPAHFASMTEIPIIAFYGPETPKIFGALSPNARLLYREFACSPCFSVYNGKRSNCTDNQCLKTIGVDEVFEHARDILQT